MTRDLFNNCHFDDYKPAMPFESTLALIDALHLVPDLQEDLSPVMVIQLAKLEGFSFSQGKVDDPSPHVGTVTKVMLKSSRGNNDALPTWLHNACERIGPEIERFVSDPKIVIMPAPMPVSGGNPNVQT